MNHVVVDGKRQCFSIRVKLRCERDSGWKRDLDYDLLKFDGYRDLNKTQIFDN